MPSVPKSISIAASIFAFFGLMSRMDSIVHGTLYRYGLQFSYEWANEYWATYGAIFMVFSTAIGLMYWLSSSKSGRDLRFSLGLVITVNILWIGGLADIMFYVFWGGGLPSNDINWWWIPWSHVFGTWTSSMQILTLILALGFTAFSWILILKKRPRNACAS
jgi:hypothetical protein